MNHTSLSRLYCISRLPVQLGSPMILALTTLETTCSCFSAGALVKAAHQDVMTRPPPGNSISTDVMGPMPETPEGIKYAVTFLELHTRVEIVLLMQSRKKPERFMLETTAKILHHFRRSLARIRADNAAEYATKHTQYVL